MGSRRHDTHRRPCRGRAAECRGSSFLAGVVDADAATVFITVGEGFAGEEEDVGTVGGGTEEGRIEGAGARSDEIEAACGAREVGRVG